MADEQDVKIAILETKFDGLRDQHKTQTEKIVDMLKKQNETSDGKFARLFDTIGPAVDFAKVNKEMPLTVRKLWDFHQQNRGFLSATRLLTGGAGGIVGSIAVLLVEWYHK